MTARDTTKNNNRDTVILNVDDYAPGRYVTTKILTGAGYNVIEAETGAEALKKFSEEKPDLVLLDIKLPDMDGFEVCKRIKEQRFAATVPILHISATYTEPAAVVKGLDGGADGYLTQPVEPLVLVAMIKSLLRLREAEAEAISMGAQWRNTFDAISGCIFIQDLDCRILQCNKSAELLFGRTEDQIIGMPCCEVVHRQSEPILECPMVSVRNELRRKSVVLQVRDRWMQITIDPILDDDGKLAGSVHIIDDVTSRKLAEEEKAGLMEQLQLSQKLESIGRLAGGIAHDFNNTLSIILGYGETLLGKLRREDPLRDYVAEIIEAGNRSVALTRQLLAFSRKQPLQPNVLDLNRLTLNLNAILKRLLGENINLKLSLSKDIHHVLADPGQIEQVIMNIAFNARDAMPEGGTLIIETANTELDETYAQEHSGVTPGKYVMLAVTDTGFGIDREVLPHIFEPFYTTKEKGYGTGLGLSSAYGIVKQSGGHIWVYSEPGYGSTFKIYLPQTEVVQERKTVTAEKATAKGGGRNILVAEDEGSLMKLIGTTLSNLGYEVSLAAGGEEALQLVKEKGLKPDLLITDVVMPKMHGSELVSRLQKNQPDLKVLYMSGYTDNNIIHHEALEPGIPFIQKPFRLCDLAEKVADILKIPEGGLIRNILMIDDDAMFLDLVHLFCTEGGHNFEGVDSAAAAIEVLADRPVDVLLVDMNIPGTGGRQVLEEIRAAGYATPAIILTGDVYSVDMESLSLLGVVKAVEKSGSAQAFLQAIEEID